MIEIVILREHIWATPQHPFYTIGRGWVAAGKLDASDYLTSLDGKAVPIDRVIHHQLDQAIAVYNLGVSIDKTYYVGNTGILVHNKQ